MQQEILLQDLTDFPQTSLPAIRTLKPEIEVQRRSPRFGVAMPSGADESSAGLHANPSRVCRAHRAGWQAVGGLDSETITADGSAEVARYRRCARSHQDGASMWLLVRLWLSSRPSADGLTSSPSADGQLPVHLDTSIESRSTSLNHAPRTRLVPCACAD